MIKSESLTQKFLRLPREEPTSVCIVCNRCFCAKSVQAFQQNKYTLDLMELAYPAVISKGVNYIRTTYHLNLKKSISPTQAVSNKIEVFFSLYILKKSEYTGMYFSFYKNFIQKITTMPMGHFSKLKGSIQNVPIGATSITHTLPMVVIVVEIVMVKLKRKLSFHSHVYIEPVCQESLHLALLYLKKNKLFYHDISTNMNYIPNELTGFTELVEPENFQMKMITHHIVTSVTSRKVSSYQIHPQLKKSVLHLEKRSNHIHYQQMKIVSHLHFYISSQLVNLVIEFNEV